MGNQLNMSQLNSLTKKELQEFFNSLTPEQLKDYDSLLDGITAAWAPLPGPQTKAYFSKADFLFYGGAAGGGKTDLMLGVALNHVRSVIFRRTHPSLRAIIERSRMLYARDGATASGDSFNESLFRWKFKDGRSIRFGSIQHDKNVLDWQGQPHDLYGFDEIPEFTEYMVRYVTAWNRPLDQTKKTRCRIIGAGNPPTTKEGEWVLRYWSPWLDDKHSNPAAPGELRWFTMVDGKDTEVESSEAFKHKGLILIPKSRTFIPSSVKDNPYLMDIGYESQLMGLPEPLRSKLLYGDFKAGIKEDPYQMIPTNWVKAAQARWRARNGKPQENRPITQLGVDVSRGGNDRTVATPRTDNFFDTPHVFEGVTTDDGIKVASSIISLGLPKNCAIAIDAIGVGTSPLDLLRVAGLKPTSLVASEKSEATDRTGQLGFYNKRAEWAWKLREDLDPTSGMDLAIYDDPEVLADLCEGKWELTPRGIKMESKDDIKTRLKRSPDKGDSLVYAHASSSGPGEGVYRYFQEQYDQQQDAIAKAKKGR